MPPTTITQSDRGYTEITEGAYLVSLGFKGVDPRTELVSGLVDDRKPVLRDLSLGERLSLLGLGLVECLTKGRNVLLQLRQLACRLNLRTAQLDAERRISLVSSSLEVLRIPNTISSSSERDE